MCCGCDFITWIFKLSTVEPVIARRNSPQPNDTLDGTTRKRLLEWWREKSENSFHSSSMHEHKLSYAFFPLLFCLTLASASCLHQLIIYVPSRERRSARDETRYLVQVLSTRCVCVSSVSDHHCTAAALRNAIMIIAVLECFTASPLPSRNEMKNPPLRQLNANFVCDTFAWALNHPLHHPLSAFFRATGCHHYLNELKCSSVDRCFDIVNLSLDTNAGK